MLTVLGNPPPYEIAATVERAAPGFWGAFSRATAYAFPTGTVVTSWHRTPASNAAAGGQPQSQHLLGVAFDAQAPDLGELERRLRAVGFVTVRYRSHVHAQAWPAGTARRAGLL